MKITKNISYPPQLPISNHREKIIDLIRNHPVVIISGETGSGKTTQLPKMCLEAGRGRRRLIGITQPRRLAATSMAARLTEELQETAPGIVGHKIRFQDRTDARTRIKFMTDGILLAEIQQNHKLISYDTIIIDEAHERNLNIDFLLGFLKTLVSRREDLKLLITSATIDTDKFSAHFNGAPVLEVSGRSYPVEVRYRPLESDQESDDEASYVDQAVNAVMELEHERQPGDVLVFMPTERDILETVDGLRGLDILKNNNTLVLPLFGRLRGPDQQRIFRPHQGRKIVVATNVAETSLTVPGIRYVIDTGLARIATYNARARTTSLPVSRISRSSCDQRQGRCGRTGPGICIRLYSEEDYQGRPEYTLPEIKRANLAAVVLRMLFLHLGNPATFPFVDPPSSRAIKDGFSLLNELGALQIINKKTVLTDHGRLMATLPLDPCIGRMLIEAAAHNALREITIIAAAISIPDPRVRPTEDENAADLVHAQFRDQQSDFIGYLKIWDLFHQTLAKVKSQAKIRKFCKGHYLSYQRMREWRDIHQQIITLLNEESGFVINRVPADYDSIHQAILSGFLRNLGRKKSKNIYQGAGGKEIMLFPGSGLYNHGGQWITAAEQIETARLFARTAANIKVEWVERIAGPLCRSSFSSPRWSKTDGRVIADETVTLFGLVIVANRRKAYASINEATAAEAREIFIQEAFIEGELRGNYHFLQHNLDLRRRLEELEDRLRCRGVVADDSVVADFYNRQLPEGIVDQAGLNRLLKQKKSDNFLRMAEEDILQNDPGCERLDDFPSQLLQGGISLPLTYNFSPGNEDDGITVTISLDLLPHIDPELFGWLVPGLLQEKITWLLKGLPKSIRKQLIPIPGTAAELFATLQPYQGSLNQALSTEIRKRYGILVSRDQWSEDNLPPHLQMRFTLVDRQGKSLNTTRDFAGLSPAQVPDQDRLPVQLLRDRWERDGIVDWDFAGLPDKLPVQAPSGQLLGFVFPGLGSGENNSVSIRLYNTEAECRRETASQLLVLYRNHFAVAWKHLKKECALPASLWALYEGFGTMAEFNAAVLRFILDAIFLVRDGSIPDRDRFQHILDDVKRDGLLVKCRAVLDQIMTALRERRETLDLISRQQKTARPGFKADFFQQYRLLAEAILPADFTGTFTVDDLVDAGRYFRALRIRFERALVDPGKDAAMEALLAPHESKLLNLKIPSQPGSECTRLLHEYCRMLQEYRVSLFAQEIKTAMPVSAKRLERKWEEIREFC